MDRKEIEAKIDEINKEMEKCDSDMLECYYFAMQCDAVLKTPDVPDDELDKIHAKVQEEVDRVRELDRQKGDLKNELETLMDRLEGMA